MNVDGGTDADDHVKARIYKVRVILNILGKVWSAKNISRIKIFSSNVKNQDHWQRANQAHINIQINKSNDHGMDTHCENQLATSREKPPNGTLKAKEKEEDQGTPREEILRQNSRAG